MSKDIITYYGKVQIPSIQVGEPDAGGISNFRINTKYINNIRQPIRCKFRSGLELTFPAVPVRSKHTHDKTFLVRNELVVGAACVLAMRDYFLNLPDEVNGVLNLFREVFLKVYDDVYQFGQQRELSCVIDYVFTENDLKKHGNMFYHDELDMLFKFGAESFDVPHPNSYDGRQLAAEKAAEHVMDKHGFVFWVEIIDNLGKYGDRYLPICNQVFKISARVDNNRPDGLYIVSSKPTNGKINLSEVSTKFYDFEDVEKELGIYQTYELAFSNGDIAALRKREIIELQHTNEITKQNMAAEKLNHEREKLKFETQLEEKNQQLRAAEHERNLVNRALDELRRGQEHMAEVQKLQLRDQMEERSAGRKDASEFIKFLPTILSGIGMLLMAYKAFRTSST